MRPVDLRIQPDGEWDVRYVFRIPVSMRSATMQRSNATSALGLSGAQHMPEHPRRLPSVRACPIRLRLAFRCVDVLLCVVGVAVKPS